MGILYLCDRKACAKCNPDGECKHTEDINHAVDFHKDVDGNYWEQNRLFLVLKSTVHFPAEILARVRKELDDQINNGKVLVVPDYMDVVAQDPTWFKKEES